MGDDPILGSAVMQTGRPQAQRSMQNTFKDAVRLGKRWLIKRETWWEIALGGGEREMEIQLKEKRLLEVPRLLSEEALHLLATFRCIF